MKALRELARALHLGRTHLSVWHCEHAVLRAQRELARALDARDAARAELRIVQHEQTAPRVPEYLMRGKP